VFDLLRGLKFVPERRLQQLADALRPTAPEPIDYGPAAQGDDLGNLATVLIVEDDPDIARFIQMNLESTGRFNATIAEDGEAALALASETEFDLILTGVMMPKIDGFELVHRLRERTETADTPIVLCTARSWTSDIVCGLALGADDYITKPFDPVDLSARVAASLRRRRVAGSPPNGTGPT
jgi:DNA-binding response OmpR family regulator